MKRRDFVKTSIAAGLPLGMAKQAISADTRPNIVWIVTEDQSKHYGFNGEPLVNTPRIDRLAAEGVVFQNAVITAPVCSPSRSAMITGMYQTSIGAHHHRSGRGKEKIYLPEHVKLIPRYFQQAGYYTTLSNIGHVHGNKKGLGKTDYNFEFDRSVYDGNDWAGRKEGQPFFAQIMLHGGKSRHQARKNKDIPHVKVEDVKLPPYYPNHPTIREDWAAYLDTFNLMDKHVGQILDRLKKEGTLDNTIIFFLTDHGVSHARGKQFCYDEGIMIPLVVWAPNRLKPQVRTDMVQHIDIAATSMHFAGIDIPAYMESRPLFGPEYKPRGYAIAARDRCDETYDRIRAVRTQDFKYIRNGYPKRPHLQPCAYKDAKEIYKALRDWHKKGKLNPLQERILFAPERAPEELYDLKNDPRELNNLANAPQYQKKLREMRKTLDAWIEKTGDQGQQVESMKMYDSDMKVYLDAIRPRRGDAHANIIENNIKQMKQWWKEGK